MGMVKRGDVEPRARIKNMIAKTSIKVIVWRMVSTGRGTEQIKQWRLKHQSFLIFFYSKAFQSKILSSVVVINILVFFTLDLVVVI